MTDTEVIEKKKTTVKEPKPPSKYNVIILNDDVTPMELVVAILISIFKHDQQSAVNIMLKVHNQGSAVVGVYSYEVAEQKAVDATNLARSNGSPLILKVEEA
jgi:ATP-dependent Clp protease adaptor protein ClpS